MSPAIVIVLLLVTLTIASVGGWLWGEHCSQAGRTAGSIDLTQRQAQVATLEEKVRGIAEQLRLQQERHESSWTETKASHAVALGELKVLHTTEQAKAVTENDKLSQELELERSARGKAQEALAGAQQRERSLVETLDTERRQVTVVTTALEKERIGRTEAEKRLAELDVTLLSTKEKLTFLDDARKQLTEQMRLIATEVVEKSGKQLNEAQQERLAALLSPVKEKFDAFTKKVESTDLKRAEEQGKLAEQLQQLMKTSTELDRGARELTAALKGDNKVAGDWGELILERVLESAGLQEGREYVTQKTEVTEDGNRQRPDVVIQLPERKNLIIDSKVSLKSWSEFASENSDGNWAAFVGSIRAHIQLLAKKDYPALYGLSSVDFTLMFIPIEPAFLELTRGETSLIQDAWNKKVMLVGPTSLQWALRMVASLWRFEDQNQNAQEIAAQAARMYDKLAGFVEELEKVGAHLNKTVNAYNGARKRLDRGRDNLLSRARKLKVLGVSPKHSLPEEPVLADYADGVPFLPEPELASGPYQVETEVMDSTGREG